MTIAWLTAFIDRPVDRLDAAAAFWASVTASTMSAARGVDGEFATLLPADGDAYLRVQRVGAGGGIHLDLHVDDVPATVAAATSLGAAVVHQAAEPEEGDIGTEPEEGDIGTEPEEGDIGTRRGDGVPVLRSPSGFVFCVVADDGSRRRPRAPIVDAVRSQVDRGCIDVPESQYDAERSFWQSLTGWTLRDVLVDGFSRLVHPAGMALELLFQRLGSDSPAIEAGGHLDLACDDVDAMVGTHVALGATVVAEHQHWTVLADPAGFHYCLIRRPPIT